LSDFEQLRILSNCVFYVTLSICFFKQPSATLSAFEQQSFLSNFEQLRFLSNFEQLRILSNFEQLRFLCNFEQLRFYVALSNCFLSNPGQL
jgi:hypothetical protein